MNHLPILITDKLSEAMGSKSIHYSVTKLPKNVLFTYSSYYYTCV